MNTALLSTPYTSNLSSYFNTSICSIKNNVSCLHNYRTLFTTRNNLTCTFHMNRRLGGSHLLSEHFEVKHLLLIMNQTLDYPAYSLAWQCKEASNQFVGMFLPNSNQWWYLYINLHDQNSVGQRFQCEMFWFLLTNHSTVKYVRDFVWILCNVHPATIYLVSDAWLAAF
jgi:hypothetical protein